MSYQELVKRGREAARSQWILGDLALEVETSYADHTLEKFADDIGVEYRTLDDYRRVAAAYEKPERSGNLSWAVHRIFAAQEDRLELIKAKWTPQSAREEVSKRIAAKAKPERAKPEPITDKKDIAERLTTNGNLIDFYDWLMDQGEARMTETEDFIRLVIHKS